MNIKILDSWLREYLKTKSTPKQIARNLSLAIVCIEHVDRYKNDFIYDIEVTTNRPDLASVVGLAQEAAAVLPQFGIQASFIPPKLVEPKEKPTQPVPLVIKNDNTLVNRICAVVMNVTLKPSPQDIQGRLEASGMRSLNNLIDITNYVMRTIGHPTHVFDYDRIARGTLVIRASRKGESIITLNGKKHILAGGDIIAEDGDGTIVDLLGVMGLENSVTTDSTKRILYFIDNNNSTRIRNTSMHLGIRTEAAVLNEKDIDPELVYNALLFGIELYKKTAQASIASDLIDIYPNKVTARKIQINEEKINSIIGVPIPLQQSNAILTNLGFKTKIKGKTIDVVVPTSRTQDISQEEDLVEEIARLYGYHNIPSVLPPFVSPVIQPLEKSDFFWEQKAKEALKYWGFTECYTYSFVSEDMYEGPAEEGLAIKNPLNEEGAYMRRTLIPSLLHVIKENPQKETVRIFEVANVYIPSTNNLPIETLRLGIVIKKQEVSYFELKGVIEQLLTDLGINQITFKKRSSGGLGADVFIGTECIGELEILDDSLVNAELNFDGIKQHATLKKKFKPLVKYPPIIEDLAFIIDENMLTADIIEEIKKQSSLIVSAWLLDQYKLTRTFHIVYQHPEKNLTNEHVREVRYKITNTLKKKFDATLK